MLLGSSSQALMCGASAQVSRGKRERDALPFGQVGVALGFTLLLAAAYATVQVERVAMARFEAEATVAQLVQKAQKSASGLVHLNGVPKPRPRFLEDPDLGLRTEVPVLALQRVVETYQAPGHWTTGGSHRRWSRREVGRRTEAASAKEPPIHSVRFRASEVLVEGYLLDDHLERQLKSELYEVTDTMFKAAQERSGNPTAKQLFVGQSDGLLYSRKDGDMTTPEINDFRVSYRIVPAVEVSILAQSKGKVLQAYESGSELLKPIALLDVGRRSPEDMIREHTQHEKIGNITLRVIIWLAMVLGMMLGIHRVILDNFKSLPILGDYAVATSTAGTGVSAAALGTVFYLLLLGCMWINQDFFLGARILAVALTFFGIASAGACRRTLREIDD